MITPFARDSSSSHSIAGGGTIVFIVHYFDVLLNLRIQVGAVISNIPEPAFSTQVLLNGPSRLKPSLQVYEATVPIGRGMSAEL